MSKSKGQILQIAAAFNALFSIAPHNSMKEELSHASIRAAINFVETCNEQSAIMGGRKNIVTPMTSKYRGIVSQL